MKKSGWIVLCFIGNLAFAQDYYTEFREATEEADSVRQHMILQAWEESGSTEAELYTSYFNYYFSRAQQELLYISSDYDPNDESEGMVLLDSLNNPVAKISSMPVFDPVLIEAAMSWINQGIDLYPDRLDMRFGKIYVLGQDKQWQPFTENILETVDYSAKIEHAWKWTLGEEVMQADQFLLNALQDYQFELYNTNNNALLPNMREIANRVLTYFPEHVESLTNIAITYLIEEKYETSLEYLFKAEKIDPKDDIVLSNIAHTYKLMGDKVNARKYYEKLISLGDPQIAAYAQYELEMLENEE